MGNCGFKPGAVFGRWTVLDAEYRRDKGGRLQIPCRCECGVTKHIDAYHLRAGQSKSCGCLVKENASRFEDLSGTRFGRLLALRPSQVRRNGECIRYECACDCGNKTTVRAASLRSRGTRSCGCLRNELSAERGRSNAKATPGEAETRIKRIWRGMRARCNNPNHTCYEKYGGRGITVCTEWDAYETFRDWALANGYASHLTIDRIDGTGNYEPSNCRWATYSQQNYNRRKYTRRRKVVKQDEQ